jgi:hypothetical protein
MSVLLLVRNAGKHQAITISSDDDFIVSEDDSTNSNNTNNSNNSDNSDNSDSDSSAYDSDLENEFARTPAAKPTAIATIAKKHTTKAPLTSVTTGTKTAIKAQQRCTSSSSSGAVFAKQRAALTAQYFTECNEQVFGSALTDVAVTWNKRLNSTAGITKLSK